MIDIEQLFYDTLKHNMINFMKKADPICYSSEEKAITLSKEPRQLVTSQESTGP